jgi:hypothetical protein
MIYRFFCVFCLAVQAALVPIAPSWADEVFATAEIEEALAELFSYVPTNPASVTSTDLAINSFDSTSTRTGVATSGRAPQPILVISVPPKSTAATGRRQQAASAQVKVIGKWSAAQTDKGAFALQLDADGSFMLVHIKDGKQSHSTGKFTVTDGQLTLTTSKGATFSGNISNLTARSFEFAASGGEGFLTFVRAS